MAQHPLYVQLTEKDGLPDIEFYDILEDSKGFIWLAANKGLYRYDGREFKYYNNPVKRGLSVFGLKEDEKGRIWCNNISGQYFFVENDSLELFTDLKEYTKGQLGVFDFYENEMLVSGARGQFLFINLNTKKITNHTKNTKLISYALKKNDTIFFLEGNVLKYKKNNEKEGVKAVLDVDYGRTYLNSVFVFGDYFLHQNYNRQSRKSKYYFGRDTLSLLDKKSLIHNKAIIRAFTEGSYVWFCSNDAVYIYNYNNRKFSLYKKLFEGKEITKMIKDSRGNYWFISSTNGIYIIPNIHIQQFKLPKNAENITALAKVNDSTLISGTTKGKINIINTKSGKIKPFDKLYSERVNELVFNNKDKIYISLASKSYILHSKTLEVEETSKGDKLNFESAKGLSVIGQDKLVYSSFGYADILNFEKKTRIRLGGRRSYTNYYSKKKNEIYISYVDGVEYYKEDRKPHVITFKEQPIFGIDIEETSDGTVWISTFNDGIIGVRDGKTVYNYNKKNGLLSNQTSTIKSDGSYLWIVTDIGIQRLDTRTKTFNNLTRTDGIISFNISEIVILKNNIYFGSNKGIFGLDKNKAFITHKLPEFYITKILVEDKEVAVQDTQELTPDENKIQFHFHANGYQSENNVTYLYQLVKVGEKSSWNTIPRGFNQVTFNSLSPGTYKFNIKAFETIEKKETAVKTFTVKVNSPFYKKWWFIVLVLSGVIAYIIYYYRKSLSEKEKEKKRLLSQIEKEKEMVFLKLENLRSQMNPHFIFNALNSIQDYILLNQKNLAGDYLGKFADLMRVYLNHSSKAYISLEEEVETLEKYLELEKLRFEDTLSYQVETRGVIDKAEIEIPTMLIQPYVENALKHGLLHKKDKRELNILFVTNEEKKYVLCKVTDNGIGREKSKILNSKKKKYHKSFATQATQDRLTLLNYNKGQKINVEIIDLYSENQKPIGTQVIIKIPYRKI